MNLKSEENPIIDFSKTKQVIFFSNYLFDIDPEKFFQLKTYHVTKDSKTQ